MIGWLRLLLRRKPADPMPRRGASAGTATRRSANETNQPRPAPPLQHEDLVQTFYALLLNLPKSPRLRLTEEEAHWLDQREADLEQPPERLTALVPRLPTTLTRLMEALGDNNMPVRQLTEIIESDPVIAANVLKLINSPALRVRREEIESLDQAVMLLGFKGMREVIAAATFSPIARLETQSGINPLLAREIWPVSLLAAAAVRQGLAEAHDQLAEIDSVLGFEIYLAALTRLTGLVALLHMRHGLPTPPSEAFCEQLVDLVPRFSAQLARAWELPQHTVELMSSAPQTHRVPAQAQLLLEHAVAFSTACTLTNRHYLDRSQLLHFCRSLPPYAKDWFALCPQPQPQHADTT